MWSLAAASATDRIAHLTLYRLGEYVENGSAVTDRMAWMSIDCANAPMWIVSPSIHSAHCEISSFENVWSDSLQRTHSGGE